MTPRMAASSAAGALPELAMRLHHHAAAAERAVCARVCCLRHAFVFRVQ